MVALGVSCYGSGDRKEVEGFKTACEPLEVPVLTGVWRFFFFSSRLECCGRLPELAAARLRGRPEVPPEVEKKRRSRKRRQSGGRGSARCRCRWVVTGVRAPVLAAGKGALPEVEGVVWACVLLGGEAMGSTHAGFQ